MSLVSRGSGAAAGESRSRPGGEPAREDTKQRLQITQSRGGSLLWRMFVVRANSLP
ncbi:hypothetical protein ACFWAY_34835 [Rhodococcus sp. NPDC059968]|uniref:hypothetical protein n=1 Tax=Rhodococcus sp. NPDC059968 TaxID=3347017 RepID=UPI00366E84AE